MQKSEPALPSSEAPKTPAPPTSLEEGTTSQTAQQAEDACERSRLASAPFAPTAVHTGHKNTMDSVGPRPQVPGYRFDRELGRGTYGVVWLAEEENTGAKVAIKFLTAILGQQWQILQAEVKQLAMLQEDPGIVQLKDFDPNAAKPYYVMTYAEGGSLADLLRQGPMPVADAVKMFRRIAEALAYVHAKGIRHCDLKPGNILLDKRGRPRVADFGQAHLSNDMSPALGTFFYMAPEQADLQAQVPDTGWDVYGLGALFYAMVTGGPPHDDSTLKHELSKTEHLPSRLQLYRESMQMAKPLTAHRQVAGMDGKLAAILERCLAVDPTRRFRTAEAVVAALDRRQRSRRQKAILCGGLLGPVLLLLILGGLSSWRAQDALGKSERDLRDQAMKSYTVSARLAAVKVKSSMNFFIKQLYDNANNTESHAALVAALHNPVANQQKIQELMDRFFVALPNTNHPVAGYFLVDAKGRMCGFSSSDEGLLNKELLQKNFAWRGYFHGGVDDWQAGAKAEKEIDAAPVNKNGQPYHAWPKTHISAPYKGTDAAESLYVAISTPIRDEHRKIVGVLLANLSLDTMNSWLEEIAIPDGYPVLIDKQFHILQHKLDGDRLPQRQKNAKTYPCDLYEEVFNASKSSGGSAGVFTDPIDGTEYVVGFVAVDFNDPATNGGRLPEHWGVLVQVKHATVIEPAKTLKNEMAQWGAMMLGVALLLILGLWLGLVWLLRREEQLAYG